MPDHIRREREMCAPAGGGRATTSEERGGRERRMRGWGEELSRDPDCAGERASGRAMIAMIVAVS